MLKRVKSLSNIGRFKKTSCGKIEFDRISIIYGRNTYGKSTLSDIFSSLESKDTSAIEARRTIPTDNSPQEAILSFLSKDDSKEIPVKLDKKGWDFNDKINYNFLVFDDEFFHKNIFAARQFTRATKENFSSFILGAEGVATATAIAEYKKEKNVLVREKNQLVKDAFPEIKNLTDFFSLPLFETPTQIQEKIDNLKKDYYDIEKQLYGAKDITSRKICSLVSLDYNFSEHLSTYNSALLLSIESHHETAQRKVSDHIATHFKNSVGAESWIRIGIEQNKNEFCQFCGQPLSLNAKKLIKVYKTSFDTAYNSHEEKVKNILETTLQKLEKLPTRKIQTDIEENRTTCTSYTEIAASKDFCEQVAEMEKIAHFLMENIQELESLHKSFLININKARKLKELSPHKKMEAITAPDLLSLIEIFEENIKSYNIHASTINNLISDFKASVVPEKLEKRLKDNKTHYMQMGLLLKRHERKEQIERYNKLDSEIIKLIPKIATLQDTLKEQQSEFLDNFFISLNGWFNTFGSNDFSLERGLSNTGNTPIFFLKVKFKGKSISEKELDRVFSESDRRALALSVFWTYLSILEPSQKDNLIVVLDDPVTSFDNGRITSVHKEIIKLYEQVRQVIILSHYDTEVSKFLSNYKRNHKIVLLSLEQISGSTNIIQQNIDDFIKNEHQQKTQRIFNFIDGKSNIHNAGDLRIFFETEIDSRFARQLQIIDASETMLSDKIDKLHQHSHINKELTKEAHVWRESLNPNHHTWTCNDIEDQRKTAEHFMDFIYNKLIPSL